MRWKLNTSNPNKAREFQRIFAQHGASLEISEVDLPEIDADELTVVVHKASQAGERVVVDDSTLDVEGAEVGIYVKWLVDHLPQYQGRKAVWTVLLAYREKGEVYVFEGKVKGTIVPPRGDNGFGFNPVFQPEGETQTLAQHKPDRVNARAIAVEALINGRPKVKMPVIDEWDGPWQKKS